MEIVIEKNKVSFTPYIPDVKPNKGNFAIYEVKGDDLCYEVEIGFKAYDIVEEGSEPILNKYDWKKYSTYEAGSVKLDSINRVVLCKIEYESDDEVRYYFEVKIGTGSFILTTTTETKEDAIALRDALYNLVYNRNNE